MREDCNGEAFASPPFELTVGEMTLLVCGGNLPDDRPARGGVSGWARQGRERQVFQLRLSKTPGEQALAPRSVSSIAVLSLADPKMLTSIFDESPGPRYGG